MRPSCLPRTSAPVLFATDPRELARASAAEAADLMRASTACTHDAAFAAIAETIPPHEVTAAQPVTVIARDVDAADLRAAAKDDARWQRQWDETAVKQAAAALPPRISDRQVLFLLRAILNKYDHEGDAARALEDCIDVVTENMVADDIEDAERAVDFSGERRAGQRVG